MEFKDVVLPSDDEEIAALEASLKESSGWKPKSERRCMAGYTGRGDRDYDPNPMAWRK
ncbi:MAG: hypothetical protein WC124_02145 [Desulfoplanes sp.]